MAEFCYLNGKIISAKQAQVSIYDIGLLRGYGIYEALTTHNKKPFMLKEHLERFRKSAAYLDLNVPVSDAEITEAILDLIELNKFKESNIKFILTGGTAIGGIEYDPDFPTFYILCEKFSPIPESYMKEGCELITLEHKRAYAQIKTTNYITAVQFQKARKDKNALEILYVYKGKVFECATSNFFIVKNGILITPKDNVLLGITRRVVIELATKNGLTVEEREVTIDEMWNADEAFLTASFKEVVPVVKIDNKPIGDGTVGPVSQKIVDLFKEHTKNY